MHLTWNHWNLESGNPRVSGKGRDQGQTGGIGRGGPGPNPGWGLVQLNWNWSVYTWNLHCRPALVCISSLSPRCLALLCQRKDGPPATGWREARWGWRASNPAFGRSSGSSACPVEWFKITPSDWFQNLRLWNVSFGMKIDMMGFLSTCNFSVTHEPLMPLVVQL